MILRQFIWLFILVSLVAGCAGGPRPSQLHYAQLPQTGENQGFPFVDKDFILAPNDVLSISLYTPAEPIKKYLLQVGDTLLVEFHQQEHLNRNIVVRPDGWITLPYISDVRAAGKSMQEIRAQVLAKYKQAKVFSNVPITLSLLTFNTRLREMQLSFYNSDTGQSRNAVISNDGDLELPLVGRIPAAGKTMSQLREDIRQRYYEKLPSLEVSVDLHQMRTNYIYVLGEVMNPGLVNIGGPMGVVQAVGAAGGFRSTADAASVVVLRSGTHQEPTGRIVDVKNILTTGDLSSDVAIRRFDVVYVPPAVIKQLNDGVLFYIRNMMPVDTHLNFGFSYMWGNSNNSSFRPF